MKIASIYPFSAGKSWTKYKKYIFNHFFNTLSIDYKWEDPRDITFVKELEGFRGLEILSLKSFDLSPLQYCKELTYLNIACRVSKKTRLDLSKLNIRTYLGIDVESLASIYQAPELKRCTISNCNLTDFSEARLPHIERLTIIGSRTLVSLKGIENFPELKLVEIENCNKLKHPTLYHNGYPFLRIYIDGVLQTDV